MLKLYSVLAVAVLLASSPALAIVSSIDATVTTSVQEFSGTTAGNSDFAYKDLNDTTVTLPLSAEAKLLYPSLPVGAQAIATFSDPTVSTTPDPLEFGFNIVASSESDALRRLAWGESTETREVNFLASEIGAEDGSTLEVESQFFVDGLVLVWGTPTADMTGTTATVKLDVFQTLPSATEAAERLNASLTLSSSGGTPSLQTTGGIAAENVIVLDLTGHIPDLGPVHLLIVPTSALTYTYPAQVGEAFRLKASIKGEVNSQPGTGASIALGVPLVQLGSLLQSVAGSSGGTQLESALSAVLSNHAQVAAKPLIRKAVPTTVRVVERNQKVTIPGVPTCGAAGAELMLFPGMVLVACLIRRR